MIQVWDLIGELQEKIFQDSENQNNTFPCIGLFQEKIFDFSDNMTKTNSF
jgi:hypothetical protein